MREMYSTRQKCPRAVDVLRRGDTVEKIIDVIKVFEFAPSALQALAIDGKVVSLGTLRWHCTWNLFSWREIAKAFS